MRDRRDGAASPTLLAGIIVLIVVAASGYGLYFAAASNSKTITLTSVSLSTVTSTLNSTVTSTTSVVVTGSGSTATQSSSSASSTTSSALFFQGALVIIPDGVAKNKSLNFTPPNIKVVIGVNNTVTWLNQDPLSQHTVVTDSTPSGATSFSVILKTGQTFAMTLTTPGTYRYYCMWHPEWMKGTITVVKP